MLVIDAVSAFAICALCSLLAAAWLAMVGADEAGGRSGLRRVAAGQALVGLGLLLPLLGGPAAPATVMLGLGAAAAAGLLLTAWGLHTLRCGLTDGTLPGLPSITTRPPLQRLTRAGAGAAAAALATGASVALLAKGPHAAALDALAPTLQTALSLAVGAWPVATAMLALTLSRRRLQARLDALARTDDLTGCMSRRALADRAPQVVQHAVVSGQRAVVLVIDLDGLKAINDRHGYRAGDAVLSAVAARLRTHLRADALLVRHGGGTFVVTMPMDDERHARLVAERLRLAVCERPVYLLPDSGNGSGLSIASSISVGLAWVPAPASLEAGLGQAELALARAKRSGRNRVEFAVAAVVRPRFVQRDSRPATL